MQQIGAFRAILQSSIPRCGARANTPNCYSAAKQIESVRVQTLTSKLAVENFDECIFDPEQGPLQRRALFVKSFRNGSDYFMILNLVVGTLIIACTVMIHTFGLILVTKVMTQMTNRFRMNGHRSRVVAMISVVFGLFVVLTVEVWFWALAYLVTGAFQSLDHALYFSTVAFSTVGFGDILPALQWRLLGALEAINGFLMIGWSTAYLIAASTRVGPFRSGEHF